MGTAIYLFKSDSFSMLCENIFSNGMFSAVKICGKLIVY